MEYILFQMGFIIKSVTDSLSALTDLLLINVHSNFIFPLGGKGGKRR